MEGKVVIEIVLRVHINGGLPSSKRAASPIFGKRTFQELPYASVDFSIKTVADS